jgi:hypothetical protein
MDPGRRIARRRADTSIVVHSVLSWKSERSLGDTRGPLESGKSTVPHGNRRAGVLRGSAPAGSPRAAAIHGRRLGLVLGEAGWGKSLLLDLFAEECQRANWHVAELNLLGLSVREFQWRLAELLHAAPRASDDGLRLARRLEERLVQNSLQQETIVLLLDDADQAGADVLTQLVRLAQLPASPRGSGCRTADF